MPKHAQILPGHSRAIPSKRPEEAALASDRAQPLAPSAILQRAALAPQSLRPSDILRLQQTLGNRAVGALLSQLSPARSLVQAKLTVHAAGDQYEQEADRIAEAVTRRPAARREEFSRAETPAVMRMPQPSPAAGGAFEASGAFEQQLRAARGRGQPLPPALKEDFETKFGADFGGVRVHADAHAGDLNRSIAADAFTAGRDVFFRQGVYDPGSRDGQKLIAHELTHVLQQAADGAAVRSIQRRWVYKDGEWKEEEARDRRRYAVWEVGPSLPYPPTETPFDQALSSDQSPSIGALSPYGLPNFSALPDLPPAATITPVDQTPVESLFSDELASIEPLISFYPGEPVLKATGGNQGPLYPETETPRVPRVPQKKDPGQSLPPPAQTPFESPFELAFESPSSAQGRPGVLETEPPKNQFSVQPSPFEWGSLRDPPEVGQGPAKPKPLAKGADSGRKKTDFIQLDQEDQERLLLAMRERSGEKTPASEKAQAKLNMPPQLARPGKIHVKRQSGPGTVTNAPETPQHQKPEKSVPREAAAPGEQTGPRPRREMPPPTPPVPEGLISPTGKLLTETEAAAREGRFPPPAQTPAESKRRRLDKPPGGRSAERQETRRHEVAPTSFKEKPPPRKVVPLLERGAGPAEQPLPPPMFDRSLIRRLLEESPPFEDETSLPERQPLPAIHTYKDIYDLKSRWEDAAFAAACELLDPIDSAIFLDLNWSRRKKSAWLNKNKSIEPWLKKGNVKNLQMDTKDEDEKERIRKVVENKYQFELALEISRLSENKIAPHIVMNAIKDEYILSLNKEGWKTIQKEIKLNGGSRVINTMTPVNKYFDEQEFGKYGESGWASMARNLPAGHIRATNLWHSQLSTSDKSKPIFEAFRSGSIAASGVGDPEQQQMFSEHKALEILRATAVHKLKSERGGESKENPLQVDVVSISLQTPTTNPLFAEKKDVDLQTAALALWNGKTDQVKGSDGRFRFVKYNVTIFNTGVNAAAGVLGEGPQNEINKAAVDKFVEAYKTWETTVKKQPQTPELKAKLEVVKTLMEDIGKNYESRMGVVANYKLPAKIANAAYLMGHIVQFNCKSGKDRTSVMDIESKFMAMRIHERLGKIAGGDSKELGDVYKLKTAADKTNYRELLKQAGNFELQKLNTGAPGYKIMPKQWAEYKLSGRVGDAADLVLALTNIVEVEPIYEPGDF
jgi:Enterobacterial virulence protein IpgD/Domain of unknown function (DUF4157)